MTHICVSKLTIIGSDNGLSPNRRQAIIRNNAGLLLIGPRGTNFNEILIEILTSSFKKMRLKMSSGKWRPFCLGLNVLKVISLVNLLLVQVILLVNPSLVQVILLVNPLLVQVISLVNPLLVQVILLVNPLLVQVMIGTRSTPNCKEHYNMTS